MTKTKSGESMENELSKYLVTGNAGDIVFQEGDSSADMYIIQDGRVELLRRDAGELKQVALLEPGDFFGEMSLLDGTPREVTARALSAFTALRLDGATFRQVARENPEIPVRMLSRAARRLHEHREAEWRAARIAREPLQRVDVESPAIPAVGVEPPTAAVAPPTASEPAPPAPGAERVPRATAAPLPAADVAPGGAGSFVHEASGTELPIPAGRTSTVGRIDRATGRTPDIDVTALDPNRTCGRRHAYVTWRDGEYRLLDEAATSNGSFVNDVRVATGVEIVLADGDRVRFGLVDLVFRRR
jgi:hypothetical protein